MSISTTIHQTRRSPKLGVFFLVMILSLPVSVYAGIVFIPFMAEFDMSEETTVEQLSGGRLRVRTTGLMSTASIDCDGDPDCSATGFDGAMLDLDQDLQLSINLRNGRVKGRSQGSFTILGLCKFQAGLKGRARCVGAAPNQCHTLDLELRMQSQVFTCPDDQPAQRGRLQFLLLGTLAVAPVPDWLMLESDGELIVMIKGND